MTYLIKHRRFNLIFFLLLLTFIFIPSCEKDTSPLDSSEIFLTQANIGVTEAWLQIEVKNAVADNQVTLFRDDSTLMQLSNFSKDSIIYDQGLLPGHSYTYKAVCQTNYRTITVENNVTTLDTTSHDFSWEIYTFGAQASSTLNDVVIINENNIWAVGEIYTADSLGNRIDPYNAVHWDGSEWVLLRVTVRLQYESKVIYTDADPIKTLFSPENNDIWFVSRAGGVTRFKDNNWIYLEIPYGTGPGGSNKICGSSSDDLYFVGSNGKITYYDGTNWQRIESGTSLPVQDIWGAKNGRNNEYEVLCVAAYPHHSLEKQIFKIENQTVQVINDRGIPGGISGLWFVPDKKYYMVGSGMYLKNNILDNTEWISLNHDLTLTTYYTNAIRGTEINDIAVAGAYGEMLHFNGLTWRSFLDETYLDYGLIRSLDMKQNIIVGVGSNYDKAVIVIGKR